MNQKEQIKWEKAMNDTERDTPEDFRLGVSKSLDWFLSLLSQEKKE